MKIIISRKGFDQKYGGVPSPILSDGSMMSLPIPSRWKRETRYDRQYINAGTLGRLVADLTRGCHAGRDTSHLDPDLRAATKRERWMGWRPIFGQAKSAQGHLTKQRVGSGDLFLFFGWFKCVELHHRKYRFVRGAPDLHVIFGWLQIEQVLPAGPSARAQAPDWARYHSHFHNEWPNNTVYIARPKLTLPGLRDALPGAGVFPKFHAGLRLTAPGETRRSYWRLPRCFAPQNGHSIVSYHGNPDLWRVDGRYCFLRTLGNRQEFVVNPSGRGIVKWAARLFDGVAQRIKN